MFNVGDTVMYEGCGVCRITEKRPEKFGDKVIMYYILKPLYDEKSTNYCPVESAGQKLRRLLTTEEINQIIKEMPDAQTGWIENDQMRKEHFSAILKVGDCKELVGLIKTLYFKRQERLEAGKKFHIADERIMKEAEEILYGEFAHVLNIKPDEVITFITGHFEAKYE